MQKKSIVDEIPTKAGCHLIVKPFNLQKFSEVFPDIDVSQELDGYSIVLPRSINNKQKVKWKNCSPDNESTQKVKVWE